MIFSDSFENVDSHHQKIWREIKFIFPLLFWAVLIFFCGFGFACSVVLWLSILCGPHSDMAFQKNGEFLLRIVASLFIGAVISLGAFLMALDKRRSIKITFRK